MLAPALIAVGAWLLLRRRVRTFAHPAAWPENRWGMKAKTGGAADYLRDLTTEGADLIAAAGFPPSVALAQAMVETGWGSSMRANPFGQRGAGDAGSVSITTTECYGAAGEACETQTGQDFARFSSLAAACRAYARFVDGPMYRGGHKYRRSDPGRWLLWLWGMGYATGPNYPSAVVDASRRVGLTLEDLRLVIPWDDSHRAILDELQQHAAGKARRSATRALLA